MATTAMPASWQRSRTSPNRSRPRSPAWVWPTSDGYMQIPTAEYALTTADWAPTSRSRPT